MTNPVYDLDKDLTEYFEFKVQGHLYKFRYLNSEEIESVITSMSKEPGKFKEHLNTFISKANPESPDFLEVSKKMLSPQLKKFNEMIKAEFGVA